MTGFTISTNHNYAPFCVDHFVPEQNVYYDEKNSCKQNTGGNLGDWDGRGEKVYERQEKRRGNVTKVSLASYFATKKVHTGRGAETGREEY